MVMTLRHIEVFHAVYRNGSVSSAARALNVSQPSVSRVLKHAERQLGFPLFRLVKGRLAPTDEAHTLSREVSDIYDQIGSLKQAALNLRRGGEGHIRLAMLPSLGLGVVPEAVARFRSCNPGVTFDLTTLHHGEILSTLYERSSDVALGNLAADHPRLSSARIGSGELVALFPRESWPNPPERVDLSDLSGRDVVTLTGGGAVTDLLRRELDARAVTLSGNISVNAYYVAAALVSCSAGTAVIDEFTARAHLTPDLDLRPLDPPIRFGVFSIFMDERPPSTLMGKFLKVVEQVLGETSASALFA